MIIQTKNAKLVFIHAKPVNQQIFASPVFRNKPHNFSSTLVGAFLGVLFPITHLMENAGNVKIRIASVVYGLFAWFANRRF